MSSILEKLKVKKPAKRKTDVIIEFDESLEKQSDKPKEIKKEFVQKTILDDSDSESDIESIGETDDVTDAKDATGVKILDKTHIGFDREMLKKRMREKGIIAPTLERPETPEEKPKKKRILRRTKTGTSAKKVSQVTEKSDSETKPKVTTKKISKPRIRLVKSTAKKPDLSVIDEAPSTMLKYGDIYSLKDRMPTKKSDRIIASSYYMNNRERFVEFINTLYYPYKQLMDADDESEEISCESRSGGDFDIMVHQKIVRDYLNVYTPYRGILLYHGLGSGKTCTSIAIAEGLKDDKQIIVMTPASLRANYISQLKFCGDLLFKKHQYWEFINTVGKKNSEKIPTLSEMLNISEKFIKSNGGAWFVNVKKESNFDELTTDEKESLDKQLNEMIKAKYKFINYNGLRQSHVDTLSRDGKINPFNNKVIIIDEAHNFISRIVNKLNKSSSISMRLYKFLLEAENCKIILLSGTPIINYPNEIAIMFNILRGYIKSWTIPLNVKSERKVNKETFDNMFKKYAFMDYLEYKPSSKKLTITRNPFGFVNILSTKDGKYKGVKNYTKKESTDEEFIKYVKKVLERNDIDVLGSGIQLNLNKALPDNLDEFKNYFIQSDGKMQNINLFKRRILGLASYFKSAQEQLMPEYDENKNYHVMKIEMSDYQFGIYESARQTERSQESKNAKKRKKSLKSDIYEDTSSTYRIFSRAFCNFVFPEEMPRPLPNKDKDDAVVDEDVFDKKGISEMLENPDGRYTMDDLEKLKATDKSDSDLTYDARIKNALKFLKDNEDEYLSPDKLETYSPKFLQLLNNIRSSDENEMTKGLHLIYSQFRTLEGIGIIKLMLEANGYTQFKLKQNRGQWVIDIPESEKDKPKFALYTGTETPEEKEIIRNVFNSTWKDVPKEIVRELRETSDTNKYGEIIQIIMITASGAEGINLRNVRHVHLIEPYWHPVRTDQVIGRARRICSHMDLLPEQRKVDVYMYLMTFTEEQKTGDQSIELRLKDLSKIDKTTPLTSDEALYEISRIKEEINKQLLTSVKETSIDCTIHTKSNTKEGLQCFSFGDVDPSVLSYSDNYVNEQSDKITDVNKKVIDWMAKSFELNGKKYMLRLDSNKKSTGKVYDYYTFQQAKKNPQVNPQYIGMLIIENKDGKKRAYIKRDE
tara:strand:- start:2736 stop:6194 length:3459 start_codon:yes stop_codon:yes gene_type:complete